MLLHSKWVETRWPSGRNSISWIYAKTRPLTAKVPFNLGIWSSTSWEDAWFIWETGWSTGSWLRTAGLTASFYRLGCSLCHGVWYLWSFTWTCLSHRAEKLLEAMCFCRFYKLDQAQDFKLWEGTRKQSETSTMNSYLWREQLLPEFTFMHPCPGGP